jgi:hypothetical protein
MATAQTDQRRSLVLAATFFVVAFAIVANRVIGSTKQLQRAAPPLTDVESLQPYLAPLSGSVARSDSAPVVATRDPFGPSARPVPMVSAVKPPVRSSRSRWVVTTVLLEGSRRSAIVNDNWVNLGDSLADGARLTAVERDHVIVTDAKGVRHRVSIQGGET